MNIVGAEVSPDLASWTKADHPRPAVSSDCVFPGCSVCLDQNPHDSLYLVPMEIRSEIPRRESKDRSYSHSYLS